MTKEKIIDGVKVEECKYYDDGTRCNEDVLTLSCDKTNCMYKQLKRLEQENERLKEELKIKENISEDFRKKALEWAEIANNYFKENSRLYKTLQETKAIAEEWMNNDWSCFHCRSNMDEKLKEILDLITKAEEE